MIKKSKEEIVEEYCSSLSIPNKNPDKQYIVCLVGQICSGKTTIATYLENELDLLRISTDDLRFLFKENGYGYEYVYESFDAIIRENVEAGYSLVLDANCGSEHRRGWLEELSSSKEIDLIWVHAHPPESFILDALKQRDKKWLHKTFEHAYENYIQQKEASDHTEIVFDGEIDISKVDSGAQLESLKGIILEKTANL